MASPLLLTAINRRPQVWKKDAMIIQRKSPTLAIKTDAEIRTNWICSRLLMRLPSQLSVPNRSLQHVPSRCFNFFLERVNLQEQSVSRIKRLLACKEKDTHTNKKKVRSNDIERRSKEIQFCLPLLVKAKVIVEDWIEEIWLL